MVEKQEDIDRVETSLKEAGVSKIFKVDTVEGIGIQELFEYLDSVLRE